METEQQTGSSPVPGQTSVKTWLSPNIRGAPRTVLDMMSRFHGDGVRYKAKLIGVDPVPDAQGDKMCRDTMMKLKGFEVSARRQGIHKQRVWLKISSGGLKILDERTGVVLYEHDRSRISSLRKDESDPRALAYIYQQQDTYVLFYIKTATLADPVLADIHEVCKGVDQETLQGSEKAQTQTDSILKDISAPPAQSPAVNDVFSPQLDSSSGGLNQTSSTDELMEIFSVQMPEPIKPTDSSFASEPGSPQSTPSTPQNLPVFSTQPIGGSPYSSPPYPPASVPWRQPGLMGNQWAGPPVAPWPTMPGSMAAWAPAGVAALPSSSQVQAYSSQPIVMSGGHTPTSPTAVNGHPILLNTFSAPTPTVDHNPLL